MKKGVILLLPLIITFKVFAPQNIYAHPGNTAFDGCHYCRTNCDKWGEIEGARHCHGGSTSTSTNYTYTSTPAPTPLPTPIPTPKPTVKPTVAPTSTSTPTATPSPTPESTIEPIIEATPVSTPEVKAAVSAMEENEDVSTLAGIIALAILALPVWGGYKLVKKLKRVV